MRLDEYTVFPYQAGDVIFAMRNGQPAVLIDPTTLPGGGGGGNFADTDLTYDNNRLHDLAGYSMDLSGGSLYRMTAGVAPPLSSASFEFIGYGSTGSDLTHVFGSGAGDSIEMYGDLSARFYGIVGFGTAPNSTAQLAIDAGAKPYAIYATSTAVAVDGVGDIGISGSGSTFGVRGASTSVQGVRGETKTGAGVSGVADGSGVGVLGVSLTGMGGAFYGGVFVEDSGGYGTLDASAILQADSTSRGFLPPRMTAAQRTAIASPAIGLIVYQTDATEGVYVNTSGGWVLI